LVGKPTGFAQEGDLTLGQSEHAHAYSYNPTTENRNFRSWFQLNRDSHVKWSHTETFKIFQNYFGTEKFLDRIMEASFGFKETSKEAVEGQKPVPFDHGNVDFSIFRHVQNKEVVKMIPVVMTTFIAVLGSLDDAIKKCENGCTEDVCKSLSRVAPERQQ